MTSVILSCIAILISIASAAYYRQQASAAQDSAASAISQARAANEQVNLMEKQLELSERIRREQSEPYVVVDVRNSRAVYSTLNLVIENIGTTIARNVKITFDPPLRTVNEENYGFPIGEAKVLKDGIPMLPPGRRIELFFDTGPDRKDCGLPSIYDVVVHCEGPFGAVRPMKYTIDVDILIGAMHLNEKTVHDGVKALARMHDDLKSIAAKIDQLGGKEV